MKKILILIAILIIPITTHAALNTGLVGYWGLDTRDMVLSSGSAGVTIDRSSNTNVGTFNNFTSIRASRVIGKMMQGLYFDGTDDWVSMGNVHSFERTNSFSFTAWVKRNESGSADQIITKMVNSGAFTGYMFAFNSSDAIIFYLRNGLSNVAAIGTTAAFSDVNKWYHVAATYDGSSSVNGMKIYVNGVSVAVSTISNSLSATIVNTQPFQLGARGTTINATSNPLMGSLDDVRVYNRTLSATEVMSIYRLGLKNGSR